MRFGVIIYTHTKLDAEKDVLIGLVFRRRWKMSDVLIGIMPAVTMMAEAVADEAARSWVDIFREIISVLVCLVVAITLRRNPSARYRRRSPGIQVIRSIWWGIFLTTLPLLVLFGAVRYFDGVGIPSVFSVAFCTSVTVVVLMGGDEVTGNILVDSLLAAVGVVSVWFTAVNGVPGALARASRETFCYWLLVCIGIAIVFRAAFWVEEGT